MLAAAQGQLTRLVVPAPCKGHSYEGPVRDVLCGTPKGQTSERDGHDLNAAMT
jgi:hypothetical protein